jgi:hypothetical protein
MTDQEIKIREMEERIKKLEDVVFNQWLSQYGYGNPNLPTNYVANVDLGTHTVVDFEHNYTQEPNWCGPFDGHNNVPEWEIKGDIGEISIKHDYITGGI